MTGLIPDTIEARSSCESRDIGRLWPMMRGPYYQHNQLVHHAKYLKGENHERTPRFFRFWPTGGDNNPYGDVIAYVIWLSVLLYPFISIGTACFCQNYVNIVNAVIICLLLVWHITGMWLASKNWKKFKRLWFVTKIRMKNLMGSQNRLSEVTSANIHQIQHLNSTQKQTVIVKINSDLKESGRAVIMVITDSYWSTKVVLPMILLGIMAVVCLVSIIIQIEFYQREAVS